MRKLGEFIGQLVPFISQVIGLFYLRGLYSENLLVQLCNSGAILIHLINLLLNRIIHIVLIFTKSVIHSGSSGGELVASLNEHTLIYRIGRILRDFLHGFPKILNCVRKSFPFQLLKEVLNFADSIIGRIIKCTATGFTAVSFIKEIISDLLYPGILNAQACLLIRIGRIGFRKSSIRTGGLLYLLTGITDRIHVRHIMCSCI